VVRTRRAAWGLALCGAAALVAVARLQPPFREVSDGAILEIYTLQALKGALLAGPYSRFGWHHPGPLFFYIEALWYWLSGLHTMGMQAGAVAINVAALAMLAWVLAQVETPVLAAAVAATTSVFIVRTGDLVASPWNPHVVVLPMLAFVAAAAAFAAAGGRALLFGLIAIGSLLVQTHVAMAPIVGAIAAIAASARLSTAGERRRLSQPRLWAAPAVFAVMLWLPVLVEEIAHRPGNVTKLLLFFTGHGERAVPLARAKAAWAGALTAALRADFAPATGVSFRVPVPASTWTTVAAADMLGLAVAIWQFRRSGRTIAAWLAAMALAASLVGLLATARIAGEIVDHQVFWLSALGLLNVGIVVAVLFERVLAGRSGVERAHAPALHASGGGWRILSAAAAIVLVGAGVAAGAAGMHRALLRARGPEDHAIDVVAAEFVRQTTDAGIHRPLVRIDQSIWPIAAGALLEIAKSRRPFAVDDAWVPMYGEAFAATGREDGLVTIGGSTSAPVVSVAPRRPRP
jgi:hypothetical protein